MKKKISMPIIVEGRYDKNAVMQIFDATVITLDGFSVFNSKEKQALIRRISGEGIILLTDPDGAGKQLRSFVSGIIPKDRIYNAYVPQIAGKERRKVHASRSGLLGVEGMGREVLEAALSPFVSDGACGTPREEITKLNFFEDGLSGGPDARERRALVAAEFGLPCDITANALLSALNIISDYSGYRAAVKRLFGV